MKRCVLGKYTLTDIFLAKDTFFGIPPDSERGTSFSITLVSVCFLTADFNEHGLAGGLAEI